MILMIDNYDSFVYNLVRYLNEIEEEVKVYRNDKITVDEIKKLNPKGIVISPGPKTPQEAGISIEVINAFKDSIPILGICLGHQAIGEAFGGTIVRGEKPMHGKVSKVIHKEEGIFKNIKLPLNVTRYHSLEIDRKKVPSDIEVTAITNDGVIMGIEHK
ncbi:MAG: anthranilate synthase component II, partial [Clostridium sp.]